MIKIRGIQPLKPLNTGKVIGNVIGGMKKFGGKNDWDFDGIVNKKDCQPRNVIRQDKEELCPMCKVVFPVRGRVVDLEKRTIRYHCPYCGEDFTHDLNGFY